MKPHTHKPLGMLLGGLLVPVYGLPALALSFAAMALLGLPLLLRHFQPPAALDECRVMQQRRQEVVDPAEAWRDIGNAWQLRTRQLGCLQLLAEWRLRKARERDLAVNFVVREEHLWSVARYMPTSLGELDSLGLSGSEIRFHGKTLISLVEKAQALPESALPAPLQNLIDMPGYRKAFKDIKALVQEVSTEKGVSAELLASRRQINQLLNWHWQLKTQAGEPELISGWRGERDRSGFRLFRFG